MKVFSIFAYHFSVTLTIAEISKTSKPVHGGESQRSNPGAG